MKSLVEEASSISKAIEKAWTRAGKPQSFSVKVFEEPQGGFLGFNQKPAKVGIFYEEKQEQTSSYKPRHNKSGNRSQSGQTTRTPHHKRHPENAKTVSSDNRRNNSSEENDRRSQHNTRPRPTSSLRPTHTTTQKDTEKKTVRPLEKKVSDSPRPERAQRAPQERDDRRPDSRQKRHPQRPVERKTSTDRPVASSNVNPTGERPKRPKAAPVIPVEKPATPTPSTRKVLRVSGRRYAGPKKENS